LKGQVIQDALGRIGHIPLPAPPEVIGSPEEGYRMRARLHVHHGRLGFFREGTHDLCDAGPTRQLLPETVAWVERVQQRLSAAGLRGITSLEIAENIPATERVGHLELESGVNVNALAALSMDAGLTGLTASRLLRQGVERLAGMPFVTDVLHVTDDTPPRGLRLRRDVRAFFQGNRYLLRDLVRHVLSLVPSGPVVDLYAGVGLFGLSLASAGATDVTLVEGDPVSGADLDGNAVPYADRVHVRRTSVEDWLRALARPDVSTFIVDPPRTGMTREAVAGILAQKPDRVVYVSCDVATLARDTRTFLDAGYELGEIKGFDLFPNTAHVETVVLLTRG
jgi:23S rRNA (uracil1939-C5)-methyltransferase